MARNLQPYQQALREAEADLQAKLGGGRASASEVAVARRAWEIMADQLRSKPDVVLDYERLPPDPRTGVAGAQRWHLDTLSRAHGELYPHLASEAASEAYNRKRQEYLDLGERLVRSPDMRYRSFTDRRNGIGYLYRENPLVPRIMPVIASELVRWFEEYPVERDFYRRGWYLRWSAEEGLLLFLKERPDMVALLRIAQTLPLDTEVSEVPIERPDVVEAVELMIGLIPVVGTLVALYEAWSGYDLFGYKLSGVERGILAAACLLPLAGRLVKGGRALYTEARLVSLYGREAAVWSRTLRVSGLAAEGMPALRTIEEAEIALRTQGRLDHALAQKASQELPKALHAPAAVTATVDQAIADLLRQLVKKQKILQGMDELALQRVLLKGPNVDHLKGQLLEELIESRLVPWLRDRAGSFALGVQTAGKKLEFIPGHLIRDANGLQITDGVLAVRNNGVLEIAAIFEAKAGKSAARELSLASGTLSAVSDAERKELRAFAKDVLREQQAAAKEAGKPFTKTLDEVEREIALSERGGQVRRDIERLSERHDGTLAQIRVGADLIPVRISPTRTKFFGVLPRDVNRSLIERELRQGGFSFEIFGADISQKELRDLGAEMVPLASKMASTP